MVTIDDIRAAREAIGDAVKESPCQPSAAFHPQDGGRLFLKYENLQRTGSFKERGALHRLLALDERARRRGVITASAGNHGQAVAFHAARLKIPSLVVMPALTPLVKVVSTRGFGAEVVLEGDSFDDAAAIARKLETERGLTFVHPFDDPLVIAGQGTIGLELLEQVPDLDTVIVPIGGGGLIAGIAVALKSLRPGIRVVGVQTAALPSMKQSIDAGERRTLPPAQTIADGIAVKQPGALTLELVRRFVDDLVVVDEEEIASAILLLLEREKTVTEGAGAAAFAAFYHQRVAAPGSCACVLLSGGNIDVNLLSRIIERGLSKAGRLIRLYVEIHDRPGALAKLLERLAATGANVLEVYHQRAFGVGLGDVVVELKLETRGRSHVTELRTRLAEHGYDARERPASRRRAEPAPPNDTPPG